MEQNKKLPEWVAYMACGVFLVLHCVNFMKILNAVEAFTAVTVPGMEDLSVLISAANSFDTKNYLFLGIEFAVQIVLVCVWAFRLNEICESRKNGLLIFGGAVLVALTGLFGYWWLDKQRKQMKEKAAEYQRDLKATGMMVCYVIYFVVLIMYAQMTGEFQNMENFQEYHDGICALMVFRVVSYVPLAMFGHYMVSVVNQLIDAKAEHEIFRKKQAEEEQKRQDEERRRREDEERRRREDEERRRREEEERRKREEEEYRKEQEKKQKAWESVNQMNQPVGSYSLEGISGEYAKIEFALEPDDFMMLGRNPNSANIVFTDQAVSGLHCQVRYSVDDRCFQVVDFSSYGTYVNGRKLNKNELTNCPEGSVLQLAGSENRFLLKAKKA